MAKKNFKIKSVNEVKVVNRNYNLYYGMAGYLSECGKLVYVKVTNIIVDLKAQSATTTLQDKEGNEYKLPEGFLLYSSPADFEANKPLNAGACLVKFLIEVTRETHNKDVVTLVPKKEGDTSEFCFAGGHIFLNNDAIYVPFEINKLEWKNCEWSILDGSVPDVFYESREEAFSHNEYEVVDEDGEKFLERGYNLRLKLTDEQKALVDEMREAFRKAKEAGVRFIWDRDGCDSIEAYNGNEVATFGYDDGCLAEAGDGYTVGMSKKVEIVDTGIDFYDYNSCDSYAFVFKKTPLQEKKWKKNHPED